jgi:hypothetical protein
MFDLSYYFYSSQKLREKCFPELSGYFNSYNRISPARAAFVNGGGWEKAGFSPDELESFKNKDGSTEYIEVNQTNFPNLHKAVTDEALMRGIEPPACYIDTSGQTRLGYSIAERYAIFVEEAFYHRCNERELRALVAHETKHLFQKPSANFFESQLNEYDCDTAAVCSTTYSTIQSYVHKGATHVAEKMVHVPILTKLGMKIHEKYPNLLGEWFILNTNRYHPSPASRMWAMRKATTEQNGSDNLRNFDQS